MTSEFPAKLADIINQGVIEFFSANGISKIESLGSSKVNTEFQWTGIIGLTGEYITGSLGIRCKEEILSETHPNLAMGMPVEAADRVDWLGEIANQVLGRIKNYALEYGMSFSLAAPTVVKGEALEVIGQGKKLSCNFSYQADKHPIAITFSCVLSEKFDFDKAVRAPKNSHATEGDSMLF
jgi:CheY-specific phosphatase CheX